MQDLTPQAEKTAQELRHLIKAHLTTAIKKEYIKPEHVGSILAAIMTSFAIARDESHEVGRESFETFLADWLCAVRQNKVGMN